MTFMKRYIHISSIPTYYVLKYKWWPFLSTIILFYNKIMHSTRHNSKMRKYPVIRTSTYVFYQLWLASCRLVSRLTFCRLVLKNNSVSVKWAYYRRWSYNLLKSLPYLVKPLWCFLKRLVGSHRPQPLKLQKHSVVKQKYFHLCSNQGLKKPKRIWYYTVSVYLKSIWVMIYWRKC